MVHDVWQWVTLFVVAASIVIAAGIVLARSGDEIVTRTGLGVFLSGCSSSRSRRRCPNSLPNSLPTSLRRSPARRIWPLAIYSAAAWRTWPSWRSSIFLVGVGYGIGWDSVTRLAAIAVGLTSLAVLAILRPSGVSIGWVGVDTIIIVTCIAAAAWMSRSRGDTGRPDPAGEIIAPTGWSRVLDGRRSLRSEIVRFGLAAWVAPMTAPVLALSPKGIADSTGASQTFIGALLLAAPTSLPELVASLAAVRIGAFDMAVGNLFGSNAISMTILLAADIAYASGPILSAISPAQAVSGVGATLLMSTAFAAVAHGTRAHFRRLEPDAIAVLIMYAMLIVLVWSATT